jgi:SNF2 family DNA or RNA helicase
VDNKLLLVRSYSTKSLADLRSLLKFALPRVLFSCLEEFDSWYDLLVNTQTVDHPVSYAHLHDVLHFIHIL